MMIEALQAPNPSGMIREARVLLELPRLLFRFPVLARQPRGSGQPVLVLPGYGAGDVSTALLQGYLPFLGYRVRGWGRGRTHGEVQTLLPRVLKRLMSLARKSGQEVTLVGCSLGGYLAREAASERHALVQRAMTLVKPVVGIQDFQRLLDAI